MEGENAVTAEDGTFGHVQVVWICERSLFMAYSENFPGLYAKDRWSASRARRLMEERVRSLLIANDLSAPDVDLPHG